VKFPDGFFRLKSAGGKDLGVGFHCEGCAQTFFEVMAAGVRHCNRTEQYPRGFFGGPKAMPVVHMPSRVGQGELPGNMLFV